MIKEEEISIKSTHIYLKSDIVLHKLDDVINKQYTILEDKIARDKNFTSYEAPEFDSTHRILELTTRAGRIAGIGAMSAVAGSISQICLEHLESMGTRYSLIENGGDIALKVNKKTYISVYAGESPYSDKVAFKVKGYHGGICTSSGSVGHSKSFGKTDATIVFGRQASICDSLATRIANHGLGEDYDEIVNNSLEEAEGYRDYYDGVMVIKDDVMGKIGHIPPIVAIRD
ncbi:MAG: hypothetical protein BZ136_05820 [Methanosphaera sp. rholeuAM74]|nr:MAG: hypothetical protein BZ136_05820 [Methanosphaera sp. rholeuAM74]